MVSYTVKEVTDKKVWEGFVLRRSPQSFLQSWNWGETQKLVGNKIFRLGFFWKKKLVGVCLVVKEVAKRGSYLVVPGGPLIDWQKGALATSVVDALRRLAAEEKVWFVRMRPELPDTPENRQLFNRLNFVFAPMHLHAENTWVLDIAPDNETLLSGMRKTTRYLVRKSLSSGLTVEQSTDPDDTKVLYRLQAETARRHNFVPFPQKLFRAQLETFGADKQASLFLCKKGKEVVAAAAIVFYGGCAYYHHSASTSRHGDLPFSYFLQWQIIQEAKGRGCQIYNLWGVAPTEDPKHRFWGVTLFKKGFGGRRVDWLHAKDLPVSPLYWLTYIFETARRIVRRL